MHTDYGISRVSKDGFPEFPKQGFIFGEKDGSWAALAGSVHRQKGAIPSTKDAASA
jgi:hypothetical protein